MQLAVGSALVVNKDDGVLTGDPLLAEYLKYLKKTGRYNLPYVRAAKKFFFLWPNPQAWVEQPLEQRLDLQREARPIITYLMLYQGLCPGYDYLLERKLSSIWREIVGSNFDQQIQQFLEEAQNLGFSHRVQLATGSQVPLRLFIQTGRDLEQLTQSDLDDFSQACKDRTQRTGKSHHHYLSAISTTQRVLFHLGIVDSPPRSGGPVPFSERLAEVSWGLRQEFIAYLDRKTATCTVKTVSTIATRLKHFGVFLTQSDPTLSSIADLDRRRHIEPWLVSLPEVCSAKDGSPISIGDRHRRVVAVHAFLTDVTEWDWDVAPARKVIFSDDIPKLPRLLPRYLPVDADRKLQEALMKSHNNELAALALRVQRACGLRIGELLDLELDCVHEIQENGAWLKVPLGKLNTERMVPLDQETLALIDRITEIRSGGRPLPHPRYRRPAQFLFTYLGRRLTQQGVRTELNHAAIAAGIDHVTSHQLRHTYATALVNAGVSLQALMALLGHSSAEMSLRYGRLFDATVRAEYERALDQIKSVALEEIPCPSASPSISGGMPKQLPLAQITGGNDWKDTPLVKTRMAAGFCLRIPVQGPCSYANICENCPSYRPESSASSVLITQRSDAAILANDALQRGWTTEVARHQALIKRLDLLIAQTQEKTG